MTARVALARGDATHAITFGTAAIERFRACSAPWWIAKAIRLLQRAGAADERLIAEVERIERGLGAKGPTL
jgi:hypothetical protein